MDVNSSEHTSVVAECVKLRAAILTHLQNVNALGPFQSDDVFDVNRMQALVDTVPDNKYLVPSSLDDAYAVGVLVSSSDDVDGSTGVGGRKPRVPSCWKMVHTSSFDTTTIGWVFRVWRLNTDSYDLDQMQAGSSTDGDKWIAVSCTPLMPVNTIYDLYTGGDGSPVLLLPMLMRHSGVTQYNHINAPGGGIALGQPMPICAASIPMPDGMGEDSQSIEVTLQGCVTNYDNIMTQVNGNSTPSSMRCVLHDDTGLHQDASVRKLVEWRGNKKQCLPTTIVHDLDGVPTVVHPEDDTMSEAEDLVGDTDWMFATGIATNAHHTATQRHIGVADGKRAAGSTSTGVDEQGSGANPSNDDKSLTVMSFDQWICAIFRDIADYTKNVHRRAVV